ncbi:hypothetical protein EC528_07000, partial [Helicobacter pylori]
FILVSLFFNLLAYFSFNALLLISQCFLIKVKKAFKPIYSVLLRNRAQIPVFAQHDIQAPHDFFLFFHV